MSQEETNNTAPNEGAQLDTGTYEIIRNRLITQSNELGRKLSSLNAKRKDVFGALQTALKTTERISTDNNCTAVDMVAVGDKFIFGYNVFLGLKTETNIVDVFSIYEFKDDAFSKAPQTILEVKEFVSDFKDLYKYYKKTQFIKFSVIGNALFMVFKTGNTDSDTKTFKWTIIDNTIVYAGNRSDHEFSYPSPKDYKWVKTTRDQQVKGEFSHISIEDKVFVETTGGDLTIKVENNTASGRGIYSEPVEIANQTLDDAEVYYCIVDNIILLKIKPYQEKDFRYIAYSRKVQQAVRVNSMKESCLFLPDSQGVIFPNGYFLQSGEYKLYDSEYSNFVFDTKIVSPNGEDYCFVYYKKDEGVYAVNSYNVIEQKMATPLYCNGYSFFENGEMLVFKTDADAKKHHAIQIWQTPFTGPDYEQDIKSDSFLFKLGNKELVKAISECTELIKLLKREDSYANLYVDIVKQATDVLDAYYWLSETECESIDKTLSEVKNIATQAIEEFDKVTNIKKSTQKELQRVESLIDGLVHSIKRSSFMEVSEFVDLINETRKAKGETISLKSLRYIDEAKVAEFEKTLDEYNKELSEKCVSFLLQETALDSYRNQAEDLKTNLNEIVKVTEANKLEEEIAKLSESLELLIDIVNNLKIEDATQTTRIIDSVSEIFSKLNTLNASLKRKRKELLGSESKAEFTAQIKLISQGLVNYLDMSDTPEKCTEYMTKLMVQLEELEGKFADFDEFIEMISQKREEVYNGFESKKISINEARNKRAQALAQSAERILTAIQNRISRMKDPKEIQAYYASDIMIEKCRSVVEELIVLEETVRADEIQSKMKSIREDAIRQLKDKKDLFVDGENIITLGAHAFTVNTRKIDLSVVYKNEELYFHLLGTDFYEKITDPTINESKLVWSQDLVSETKNIYRAEYLAYELLEHSFSVKRNGNGDVADFKVLETMTEDELLVFVQKSMAVRYGEGYVKGVHDKDTVLILKALIEIISKAGLLKYSPETRACALMFWACFDNNGIKNKLYNQLKSIGNILQLFPDSREFDPIIKDLQNRILAFVEETKLFSPNNAEKAGEYLFYELIVDDVFVVDQLAQKLHTDFLAYLKKENATNIFKESIDRLAGQTTILYTIIRNWISSFVNEHPDERYSDYIDEAATLLFAKHFSKDRVQSVSYTRTIEGMQGAHNVLEDGKYELNYYTFIAKMNEFAAIRVPMFKAFQKKKQDLLAEFTEEIRLNEFKPRVLSSFVRNKLIDKVYLPLIGNNLAKQMGSAGENKRTDLMGMLLLISPPGYGKTTIMEYIANRLGLIFMKINGPAIGHEVTSVDPQEAPNATAREELMKLNLSFEMGNNVMIYIDDIQHCNPEFLQKFISLCDAQRKIEGVYKGKTKTYDFRGKKVCVVMAGNPYTESGDKFKIPDMLANRADIYNIGDILGDNADVFNLSYIENSLTSNVSLQKLASKEPKDLHPLLQLVQTGKKDGADFEANHTPDEVHEYVSVLKKLLKVRDIITVVNQAYIESAAQADEYRTEPPFKLQGSYRDMNKIAEKIMPIMNEQELDTVIESHYQSESQTLTTGAEANLLKFKELTGKLTPEDKERWAQIKQIFVKQQKLKGMGQDKQMGLVAEELGLISTDFRELKVALIGKQKNKK